MTYRTSAANASRDFDRKVINALARKGITITGLKAIPAEGFMPFANADRGYAVNDKGCSRILTYRQVLEAAQ